MTKDKSIGRIATTLAFVFMASVSTSFASPTLFGFSNGNVTPETWSVVNCVKSHTGVENCRQSIVTTMQYGNVNVPIPSGGGPYTVTGRFLLVGSGTGTRFGRILNYEWDNVILSQHGSANGTVFVEQGGQFALTSNLGPPAQ